MKLPTSNPPDTQMPHPQDAHAARLAAGKACLDAALAYHARGFSVVCCCDPDHIAVGPKHGAECTAWGKSPVHLWKPLQAQSPTVAAIKGYWKGYDIGNVGIVLGQVSGLVRVDVDGPVGEALLTKWSAGDLPPTWAFRGSLEGRGLLYSWDKTLPCQSVIDTHQGIHKELRLMGNGSQTIMPPSRHPSGRLYTWDPGSSPEGLPLAPAPPWLVARMTPAPRASRPVVSWDTPDATKIASALQAIPNNDADYDLWMRLGMALQATGEPWARDLWDTWSVQSPKFNAAKQEKSWQSFYLKADGVKIGTLFKWAKDLGWKPPREGHRRAVPDMGMGSHIPPLALPSRNGTAPPDPSGPFTDDLDTWQQELVVTKEGKLTESFRTLTLLLEHTPPWGTTLWYDTVREFAMVDDRPLTDHTVSQAAVAIECKWRLPIRAPKLVQRALEYLCHANPRDLLREWLEELPPWDGVKRLTCWLSDHAGAPRTDYGMAVSRLLPVSMVARAMHPGCQYRHVVILEGNENIGKSKLVKALASPAWYREVSHGFDGKEGHMILAGAWVIELAEMSSYTRTEETRLKAFITMERDEFIPKYSNLPVARPRRAIFVMTVNPEGDTTYLRGQTGNTRYLPITVEDIHPEDVEVIRDQLFAEALAYYRDHPIDWWMVSEDATTETRAVLESRRQTNIYEHRLSVWVDGRTQGVTTDDIFEGFLQLDAKEKWKDMALQKQIAAAMRALGWTSQPEKDKHADGTWKSVRRWRPPGYRLVVSTGETAVST